MMRDFDWWIRFCAQRGGEMILSQAPGKRQKEATTAQKAQQEKFQQAIIYGKTQIADATARAE